MQGSKLDGLPQLGVGIGYRPELRNAILENPSAVDWLEVITEHYIQTTPDHLRQARELRERFVMIPHGIDMSIGTVGPIDMEYVDGLAAFVEEIRAPWFSDHLCFTRSEEVALGALTPLPRTREMAAMVADKARYVQERVGRPFLLENITYYVDLPGELSESEFIREVVEQSGCGLLLDLTNVYINSVNHRFDPIWFLDQLPLGSVVQVHLAGGVWHGSTLVDSHDHPVPAEVWDLLRYAIPRSPIKGILLERDEAFPGDFSELAEELELARGIQNQQLVV